MSYNLYINSTDYHPSTISEANVSQRVYAVDWSFLPNNKKFKVSFDYASGRGQYNPDQTGYIVMNLNNSSNVTNSEIVEFQSTNIIGFFMPVARSTRNAAGIPSDIAMIANPDDNPQFVLCSNSLNGLLEVLLYNLDGTQFTMANQKYQMTLHFEPF
jgi:hypothetical protein